MKISKLMTSRVETIHSDNSAKEAAQKMRDLHIGYLPVVDDGRLVGIITDRDITCKVTAAGHDAVMTKVKTVMTTDVSSCYEDQDISEAVQVMSDHHLRRLTILKRDNSMAGILSIDDLAHISHDLASTVLEAATPVH